MNIKDKIDHHLKKLLIVKQILLVSTKSWLAERCIKNSKENTHNEVKL